MLEELTIRDYAIVDKLTIRFREGLNLLTGETGAGKSILIGALGFLLGEKADTGIIRTGAEEAIVSGTVLVEDNPDALAWLAERDLSPEDGALIIRRSIKRSGRGSAYVQGAPVTRQDLLDLAQLLVEVHGQRDSQALLKKDRHRLILDRFAGIGERVLEYGRRYAELATKRQTLEAMAGSEADRAREAELARYALEEIDEAKLRHGEDDELAEEELRLGQHEKLFAAVSAGRELLADAEGALPRLRKARASLEAAVAIDPRLGPLAGRVDDAFFELEDAATGLRAYADGLSFDPGRLEEIESRLALIQKLKRKYGATLAEVLSYRATQESRLNELEHWDEDRTGLEAAVAALEASVYAEAEGISKARAASAAELEAKVLAVLATLGMAAARFAIRLERKEPVDGKAVIGPYGLDEPEFYVSFNRGEALKPLSLVASGGELSRVMLALKSVLAGADGVPTMIFDEVDTGIGGEVAIGVGAHLSSLARSKQVLCITHLASIAARADTHYRVEKRAEGERTVTSVSALDRAQATRELARMLSGDAEGKASLAHAEDLLRKLGATRGS